MQPGQKFSDERVKALKMALLRGVHPRVLARVEGVNLNTILRMRNGETYAGVKVFGEERLRPQISYEDVQTAGEQVSKSEAVMLVPGMSEEELQASAARVMAGVETKRRDEKVAAALDGVSQETRDAYEAMFGKQE
jgi:hypothetical protein